MTVRSARCPDERSRSLNKHKLHSAVAPGKDRDPSSGDQDRKVLFDQLRRIGCQTECIWPPPNKLAEDYDIVFFLLSGLDDGHSVAWMAEGSEAAHIAIIAYETPDILEEISPTSSPLLFSTGIYRMRRQSIISATRTIRSSF